MPIVDLFKICCELVHSYDPNLSPQTYLSNLSNIKSYNEYETEFITDVFYGCCDRKAVLDVVVDGFYSLDGKNNLRSERSMYSVITYVILFRVKEFGISELKVFGTYPKKEKLYKYINFFLNERNLLTWIRDAWTTRFEEAYVDDNLMNPLSEKLPILKEYLKQMETELFYTENTLRKPSPTRPEPFNLSDPPPRKILLPDPLPDPPVFKSIKTKAKSSEKIDSESSKLHKSMTQPNMKATQGMKKESSTTKLAHHARRVESKSATEQSKPQVPQFKARPFKPRQNESDPVKLNAAAILKDEHVIKKQTDDLLNQLAYLESGQGHINEFVRWQTQMRMSDLKDKQEKSELNKLQSKLSYEEAIAARQNVAEYKKKIAKKMQEETLELMERLMEKQRQESMLRSNQVKEIIEDEKKIKQIKEQVRHTNKQIALEVVKESQRLQELAYKEIEEEMRKKLELIQQIKAAESIHVERTKLVDLTSTAGHGLLAEMSIAELYERLELVKQDNEDYKKRKRDEIIRSKIDKEQSLVDKLNFVNKFRNDLSINMNDKKNKEKEPLKKVQEEVEKSESVQRLKKKIEEKKLDRLKTLSSKQTPSQSETAQQYNIYSNQRKQLESNRFKDLEQTNERYRFLNNI